MNYIQRFATGEIRCLFGNMKNISLKKAFEYKQKMESEIYKKHGPAPCFMRAKFFSDYINLLEKNYKK